MCTAIAAVTHWQNCKSLHIPSHQQEATSATRYTVVLFSKTFTVNWTMHTQITLVSKKPLLWIGPCIIKWPLEAWHEQAYSLAYPYLRTGVAEQASYWCQKPAQLLWAPVLLCSVYHTMIRSDCSGCIRRQEHYIFLQSFPFGCCPSLPITPPCSVLDTTSCIDEKRSILLLLIPSLWSSCAGRLHFGIAGSWMQL